MENKNRRGECDGTESECRETVLYIYDAKGKQQQHAGKSYIMHVLL
jgi:hypothetical protein